MHIVDKYYLVHNGTDCIMAGFTTGELSSSHTIETFNTDQLIVDRASNLGLTTMDRYGVTRELSISDFP
jgi:hypothetical protein